MEIYSRLKDAEPTFNPATFTPASHGNRSVYLDFQLRLWLGLCVMSSPGLKLGLCLAQGIDYRVNVDGAYVEEPVTLIHFSA